VASETETSAASATRPRHLLSPSPPNLVLGPPRHVHGPHAAILTPFITTRLPSPIAFHPPDRLSPPPNHSRHHILNRRSRPPPQKSLHQRQDTWLLPVHTDDYILSLYIQYIVDTHFCVLVCVHTWMTKVSHGCGWWFLPAVTRVSRVMGWERK
jgi:hypothetical protein